MDMFMDQLKKGLQPIAKGSFGKVFRVEDTSQASNSTEDVFAVKEIFFENDGDSELGQKNQTMLAKEIEKTQVLQDEDPEHVFFPEYFFYVNATEEFESEAATISDEAILANLKMDDSHDVALFFMESMDYTLEAYENKVKLDGTISHFITRLRLFKNVCTGLLKILSLMSHCDLKPANIMLKKISKKKSAELVSEKHLSLRLSPIEYFQVKIIDFRLADTGTLSMRMCGEGTLQYLPVDYLQGKKDAPRIDVYAIGLMMFDLEMADLGLSRISEIMKVVNFGFGEFTDNNNESSSFKNYMNSQKQILENNEWYKIMNHLWTTEQEGKLFEYLEKDIDMETIVVVMNKHDTDSLREIDPFEFISHKPLNLYHVLMATLNLFLDTEFKEKFVKTKVDKLENALAEVKTSLENIPKDSDEYQKTKEFNKYYEARITLENELADTRVELLKYLLTNVINIEGKTPKIDKFSQYIKSILNRVTKKFKKEWEYVFKFEEHYLMINEDHYDETKQSLKNYLSEHPKEPNPFARLSPKFILL
jgi:serine/threonine protein kinase